MLVSHARSKEHEDLVTDWAYRLPDDVWALPEAERTDKARFTNDLCQLNQRHFIRCVLDVPFTNTPGSFVWGGLGRSRLAHI